MFYSFATHFDGFFNLFRYITFRTGASLFTAFLIYFLLGKPFINLLHKKFIQPIRTVGPQSHLKKQGTPTMGGILIIFSVLISSLLWCNLKNGYVWIVLFTMLAFGFIGFIDDYLKIVHGNAYRGLSAKLRLIVQSILSLIASFGIYSLMPNEFKTAITLPFFKNILWDIGIFYFLFVIFVIVGTSNSVNLTDGLDGLLSMVILSSFIVFMLISYLIGRADFSLYLFLPYIPGAGEITVLLGALIGAVLGFLWFNAYPAKVFMGDVGSLALGSSLGVIAVITKNEFLLAICGAIFVLETLSVIIQLFSKKFLNKKFLKMAPLHHHLELSGWKEQTIVIRFWIISIILALIALSSLKIR